MTKIQFNSTICRDLMNAERMAFVWWLYWLGGGLDGDWMGLPIVWRGGMCAHDKVTLPK